MPSGLNANPVLTGTAFARIGDGIAASTNGGVFRTNDEGATWTNISPGLPSTNVFVLARDSDDTLYAATLSGGMARYTEPAGRWTAINNGLPSPSVWSLAVGPAGEVYAGTAEALARSDDRGATWRLLKRGMIATRMQTLAQAWDGAIYAGSVNNGLARSDDGGRTWTEINQGLPGRSVRVLAVNYAGHVYTGFPGVGIFRSRDQGLEWRRTNEGLPAQPNVAALLALPDSGTMLAALTNGGVYRSRDFGDSWQPSNRGLVEERASTLARGTNGDLFVFSGNRVFGSNNEGASWLGLGQPLPVPPLYLDARGPGYLLAGSRAGLYRLDAGAEDWVRVPGPEGAAISAVSRASNGDLLLATDRGLFRSAPDSPRWQLWNEGMENPFVNVVIELRDGRLALGTFGNGVFLERLD